MGLEHHRVHVFAVAFALMVAACGGSDDPLSGSSVGVTEKDVPGIYAAVAVELAKRGQVDGVVYFEDQVARVDGAETPDLPVLTEPGALLSDEVVDRVKAAISRYSVAFGPDWMTLAREECDKGRPWGEPVFYRLGTIRVTGADTVEVLVSLQDVNSPGGERLRLTLDRSADGWLLVNEEPTDHLSPPADLCL